MTSLIQIVLLTLSYEGQQTIYHAGKAGFAAYMAHATETVSESEMRLVSL